MPLRNLPNMQFVWEAVDPHDPMHCTYPTKRQHFGAGLQKLDEEVGTLLVGVEDDQVVNGFRKDLFQGICTNHFVVWWTKRNQATKT